MNTSESPAQLFPQPAGSARLVLSTAPAGEAEQLAERLVEERLAACVNLVPGVRSIYRWREGVHNDPETILVVKTDAARLEALGRRLEALHSYDVPEFLVVAPEGGSAAYLAWLAAQVAPLPPAGD